MRQDSALSALVSRPSRLAMTQLNSADRWHGMLGVCALHDAAL